MGDRRNGHRPRAAAAKGDPQTTLCVALGATIESIQVNGLVQRSKKHAPVILLRAEYLRPGPSTWLSLASSIASRMGLAHAPSGTWVVYLTVAAMIAICALGFRFALLELLPRVTG